MTRTFGALVAIFALCAAGAGADALQAWFLAGNRPQDYTVGRDQDDPRSGAASAFLQSRAGKAPDGFGTLMQTFDAADYAGKRVRMTADVRARNVERWAGLWMRVDAAKHRTLAFDNMQDRPIAGTRDWQSYSVVLDVPAEGESISAGVLLTGSGKVWIDNVRFEEVDRSVPVTGSLSAAPRQGPANLDFESQ